MNGIKDIFERKCRECGTIMELKGDMRYEDSYYECPNCGAKQQTIYRSSFSRKRRIGY